MGTNKAKGSTGKIFLLGILAGAFIALGCLFMTSIGGNLPQLAASNNGLYRLTYALVFPFGLLMVVLSGAELYTGNTALVSLALFEGKISFGEVRGTAEIERNVREVVTLFLSKARQELCLFVHR